MRLWLRLTLAMAVVALLPLAVTGALALRSATTNAVAPIQENQVRSAEQQAEFIEVWLRSQVGFLDGWREVYAGRIAALPPVKQRGFLNSVYRSTDAVVVVALVAEDGSAVVEPAWLPDPPAGRVAGSVDRAELLLSLAPVDELSPQSPAALGDLYVPEPGGPPSVAVAVLVADGPPQADGRPGWLALVAEISLADVMALVGAQTGPDLGVALLDSGGVARYGADHPLVRPDLVRPLAGNASWFEYGPPDHEVAVHGATSRVRGTEWTVVVVRPSDLVFQAVGELRTTLQVTVAVSILLALALGIGLGRTVAAPLARLRDSVLEVASGRLGQQVPTGGGGELTELAQAFNHMSRELARTQGEVEEKQARIESFNRELQDRVEARTAELRAAQGELVRSGQLAAVAEVGAGLAHELNNPLAGILGLTQVLRVRHAEGLDASLLADIEGQAQRCREVVEAMQRFASPDVDPRAGGVVDLRVVLTEVEALVRGPFRQRGVHLEVERAAEALPVQLEPVHGARLLAQILQTLRAGLPDGATLAVAPRRRDDVIEVRFVPDREPGASLDRADDQRAAGLGLWVARELAVRSGGQLLGEGEHDLSGLAWLLELPAAGA